jgi:translation initiation factor 2 alpha subunit (eIF-2alpha)
MNVDKIILRRLYDSERLQPNRNYAKDHSFDEWLDYYTERKSKVSNTRQEIDYNTDSAYSHLLESLEKVTDPEQKRHVIQMILCEGGFRNLDLELDEVAV